MSNPICYRTWNWEDYRITYDMDFYTKDSIINELEDLKEEQILKNYDYSKKHLKEAIKKHKEENDMEM